MNYEKGFDRISKIIANIVGFIVFLLLLKCAISANSLTNAQAFTQFLLLGIAGYLLGFAFIYLPLRAIIASVKWICEGFYSKS